jgi:hypothetical protein
VTIQQATRSYESWAAGYAPPVVADLRLKHRKMTEGPYSFLRATFYRWLQIWPTVCPTLATAPGVLAVGDLHVENFGTWRDTEGRLVWGVNDVDEACTLPYTQDLVRLATSALLAARERRLGLSLSDICTAMLDGYATALKRGGRPFILAERSAWLRDIAISKARDPVAFWNKLDALPTATRAIPAKVLRAALPDPRLPHRIVHRVAGVGSLGRPRFVALAQCGGALVAREAKARVPTAANWVNGRGTDGPAALRSLIARAVRMPDPFLDIQDDWIVRRLAPDCSRIELTDLPRLRDALKLFRAMGGETANLHLGTPRLRVSAHLARQHTRWLEDAATAMAQATMREWHDWTA